MLMRRVVAALAVVIMVFGVVAPAMAVDYPVDGYVFPSTNEENKTNGGPYVHQVDVGVGWVELEFVDPQGIASFEYRIDGNYDRDLSQALPHQVIGGDIRYRTWRVEENDGTEVGRFEANETVEIRKAGGAERDTDFDWVTFFVLPETHGNPTVIVGDNSNANDNDQGNDQDQNQDPDQDQDVDQDNDNDLDQDNTRDGDAGGSASSGCEATQGEDAEGDDNTSCESGGTEAGDSSTGNSNQANAGEQSGANSNSQEQTLTGGNQANAPESTTDQNASNELEDIGGDVDNSVDTVIDDHSDDDVTDNKGGEIDSSQDNDGIDGNENQVNLVDDLLEQLGRLLRRILNNLPIIAP